MKHAWMAGLMVLVACKGGDKAKSNESAAPAPAAKAAAGEPAADAKATEIAARPRVIVVLDKLGLQLSVPEGTKDASDSKRPGTAHLETAPKEFMVNVDPVDQYSQHSFAEAETVYEKDKLIEWYTKEQTPTGWVTYKAVESELYRGARRYEVNVRTTIAGKAWDCQVSSPAKAYADAALEACKSLDVAGAAPKAK